MNKYGKSDGKLNEIRRRLRAMTELRHGGAVFPLSCEWNDNAEQTRSERQMKPERPEVICFLPGMLRETIFFLGA